MFILIIFLILVFLLGLSSEKSLEKRGKSAYMRSKKMDYKSSIRRKEWQWLMSEKKKK